MYIFFIWNIFKASKACSGKYDLINTQDEFCIFFYFPANPRKHTYMLVF